MMADWDPDRWMLADWGLDWWTVGAACITVSAVTLLWWLKRGHSVKAEYYERVRRRLDLERHRRELLAKQLAADGQLLTEQRQQIVELPLQQLIEQLRSGQLTAVQVLRAYQAKALEVTGLYNCITEFVLTAEERATALDALPESSRGPLHGVPISVKDSIDLEGYDSTVGLAKYLGEPAAVSAPLLQTLIDLGGVPFCKTNIPQTLISFGCSNPVWGVTTNMYDADRVPGGSSGGEGLLVAAGGSPLGIGSDLGGSVRVPALFSGCCGLKPTYGRISDRGMRAIMPATFGLKITIGFLTREVADIECVMRLVTSPLPTADMYRLDPLVPRAYWNSEQAAGKRRWRIGYMTEMPFFPATPGVRRVVTETVQALEAAGHELVPFQLECDASVTQLFFQMVMPENGVYMLRSVSDEEVDKSIASFVALLKTPSWLRRLLAWGTGNRYRYRPSRLRAWTADTDEAVQVQAVWDRYVEKVLANWRSERLDLLLLPGFMCPPPPRDMISNLVVGGLYTAVFNVLNFPAGILTVGHETAEDQAALEAYPTPYVEHQWIKEATRGALGQPLGVQVACLPWMEEQLLAGMKDIQQALRKHNK